MSINQHQISLDKGSENQSPFPRRGNGKHSSAVGKDSWEKRRVGPGLTPHFPPSQSLSNNRETNDLAREVSLFFPPATSFRRVFRPCVGLISGISHSGYRYLFSKVPVLPCEKIVQLHNLLQDKLIG